MDTTTTRTDALIRIGRCLMLDRAMAAQQAQADDPVLGRDERAYHEALRIRRMIAEERESAVELLETCARVAALNCHRIENGRLWLGG